MTRSRRLDTTALDHLYGFRLALAEAATRRVFDEQIGQPLGLRPVEFSLLALLLTHDDATPKQLAEALRMKSPQMTVLLDRLGGRDLLERRKSATDGRSQRVLLTAAGRRLITRALAVSQTMEAPLVQALSTGERAMLHELLAKLAAAA